MKDESEYDHVPPTAVERRRLVVEEQCQHADRPTTHWANGRLATRADVEQWAASHGLALVTADDFPDTEEPGDSGALQRLRECIDEHLGEYEPDEECVDPYERMVKAAVGEIERLRGVVTQRTLHRRDAVDALDAAIKRAEKAEADRDRLARAVARYHGASRDHRHQTCGYCDAIDAIPEHIRREL